MAEAAEPLVDDGRLDGGEHRYRVRVFYEDTDAGGVVYHANYLRFAERARTSFLRLAGIGQRALRDGHGVAFVVRRCEIDFNEGARLDDVLEVRSTLSALKGASVVATQRIHHLDADSCRFSAVPLCVLTLRLACIGGDGRPARFPPHLRGALAGVIASKESMSIG